MCEDAPRRLDPAMDPASAAIILGCEPRRVGPCVRYHGLTVRYGGPKAQTVCPYCPSKAPAADGHP
ncbi:hypothetical protein GCM10010341_51510 [Streptomyces noursei]|nr:hypothetical protein GCM10010341_51510 [Streptomyces noursei]